MCPFALREILPDPLQLNVQMQDPEPAKHCRRLGAVLEVDDVETPVDLRKLPEELAVVSGGKGAVEPDRYRGRHPWRAGQNSPAHLILSG